MKDWNHDGSTIDQVRAKHGPWTAMSIRLPDGACTLEPSVDHRLKRLVQVAADLSKKPLAECRVLDLACLEGHYGIEFAMHGAEVVCVEIREANLAKAAFAIDALGLTRCRLVQDDVRHLNRADYGEFDIIVCSGILYHLQAHDAAGLIHQMGECCRHLCIVDTYVAVSEAAFVDVAGRRYGGFSYREHAEGASAADKAVDLWASIDNDASFWFTPNGLAQVMADAGFTSSAETLLPPHPGEPYDRRNIVAIKGTPQKVWSSTLTDGIGFVDPGVPDPTNLHPYVRDHGVAYRMGKRFIPQSVKDAIKPTLRSLGILKTQAEKFPTRAEP